MKTTQFKNRGVEGEKRGYIANNCNFIKYKLIVYYSNGIKYAYCPIIWGYSNE